MDDNHEIPSAAFGRNQIVSAASRRVINVVRRIVINSIIELSSGSREGGRPLRLRLKQAPFRARHTHGIAGKAYGFPYDDVGGYSSDISCNSPQYLAVAIGW